MAEAGTTGLLPSYKLKKLSPHARELTTQPIQSTV